MLKFELTTFKSIWKAYAGSQTLQSIILLCTGTNKDGGYLAPKWLFLCMYIGLTLIWAFLNTFALEVIAFIDIISIWWQVKSYFGCLHALSFFPFLSESGIWWFYLVWRSDLLILSLLLSEYQDVLILPVWISLYGWFTYSQFVYFVLCGWGES